MSEQVGAIHYTVDLETAGMIAGQRKVQAELDKTSSSLSAMTPRLTAVAGAVGVMVAALAAAAIKSANMADDMRMLGARIEVAAGNMESGATAMAALEAISKRTGTSIAANAEVFTRLNQSILQMGGTQSDTLRITELLGKAIRVSGASAVEAKSAMLQFGQALGSGKLQGDELRSLMENAPYLMKQLADGIGVPVGALKKMGEEGKLTADVVTNALSKAAVQIDADFQKFPQTISSAMDVAIDAAGRANQKFDELSGTSTALTGITKGLGEVLDKLAQQFGAANTEAGTLGRNKAIASWADSSKIALSYVIDAADMAWQTISVLGRNVAYVFTAVGTEIGGIGAQIASVMRGDFAGAKAIGDAMTQDAEARRKALDDADKKTTGRAKLAGQAMREAWEVGAGGGRGSINPEAAASTLTSGASSGKPAGSKKKAAVFDEIGYLATLKKETVDSWDAITAAETEAVRNAAKLLAEKKISRATHEQAVTLIASAAAQDRQELMAKETQNFLQDESTKAKAREAAAKEAQALEKKKADEIFAITKAVNPIDALRQEYEAKLAIVTEYETLMAQRGVDATAQGQITRTQITAEYELQRTALAEQSFRSQSDANAFLVDTMNAFSQTATSSIVGLINGTMNATDVMRNLANVVLNEAVGSLVQIGMQQVKNAMFAQTAAAAETAGAAAKGGVYAAAVAAQVSGMSAMAAQNAFAATAAIPIVGPGLASAAAASAAAIAASLGAPAIATAPIAGARQYGGPVTSGSLYRVNEKGSPEMFTAGNGSQYMLPTTNGSVTAADKLGGGGQGAVSGGASVKVVFNVVQDSSKAGTTNQSQGADGTNMIDVFVAQIEGKIADGINTGSSPVSSALQRTYALNRGAGSY